MNNSELSILRDIDLNDIMNGYGYERDKKQSDSRRTVYQTDIGKISIMGTKFFNFSTVAGGGGAIDLVMALKKCKFEGAVKYLKGLRNPIPSNKVTNNASFFYSEKKTGFKMPEKDNSKINIVINYLVKERGISPDFVASMIKIGAIYSNKYASVVFKHCSFIPEYRITGATLRGTKNAFKQTIGNKNDGLFWFGNNVEEAERIIIAESPIDTISYFCLKGCCPNTCYISLSGISFPSSFQRFLKNKLVILATDNPFKEKNKTAVKANSRLEKDLKSINQNVIREIPLLKDWNEDLMFNK